MSWVEIKHALNSKLGESDMKALDELIDELASTLENINDAVATVDDNVNAVKTNTAASTTAAIGGTLSQKLEYIIDTLLGTVNATGGTTTAGSIMAKLNALLTSWTSTRAGYIDNIRSYTLTNNTASKTGVLSAKLAYVINLLENTTYGLSAIKTKLNNVGKLIIHEQSRQYISANSTETRTVINTTGSGELHYLLTNTQVLQSNAYATTVVTVDGTVIYNIKRTYNSNGGNQGMFMLIGNRDVLTQVTNSNSDTTPYYAFPGIENGVSLITAYPNNIVNSSSSVQTFSASNKATQAILSGALRFNTSLKVEVTALNKHTSNQAVCLSYVGYTLD